MTSNRRPLPPPNAATVVAGTPKLAVSASGPSTAPMGQIKEAVIKEAGAEAAAPLPVQGHAPATAPGAGAFQPAAAGAAGARRAGLWGTVVGVGPSFLKSIAANKQSAREQKSSAAKGEPSSNGARAASSRPDRSKRSDAASSPSPIDSSLGSEVSSGGTRVSAGVPKLAAPTPVSPVGMRSSRPSSGERESERESRKREESRRAAERRESRRPSRPQPSRPQHSQPQPSAPQSGPSEPGLFRKAVVEARRAEGAEVDFLAGFKPKGWSVLLLLASLVALLFVGAALATVEVTAEAQGMLRAPKGLRPVASVLGGSLAEVLVQSGDQVQPGQVVARLEATELRANLITRERELETTQTEVTESDRRDRQIEERASQAMQRRRAALQGRIAVNNERLAQRVKQSANYDELERQGGASADQNLSVKDQLQSTKESISALSAEVALLDLEIADRARQWQERDSARRAQLARAQASVDEARAVLASSEIRAPAAGQIESLLATPGGVVEAGGLLANIVPAGAPRTIVAFVPSRDIAFVAPGAEATVEVQSLSISEFGLGKARVSRVSSDVATPLEVQSTLGEQLQGSGSVVRVELELVDSETSAEMNPHLRSGERVMVRLHRRERRVITLLFDFVRKWLE